MKNRCIAVCVALLVGVIPPAGRADFRPQPLTAGMSPEDVLSMWGAPLEREDRETKREATWHYPGRAMVAFANGRVVRWDSGSQSRSAVPLSPAMATTLDSKEKNGARAAISEGEMQDILDEMAERSEAEAKPATSPQG